MDKATTVKEVNQVFIDQGTAVAIIVILVTLLATYFGVKILMAKREASQRQKWKEDDRAYDRLIKDEERQLRRERDDKIAEAQERNTEALKDLIREVTKAVETNNYSIQRFEDKLQSHTEDANVNLGEVNNNLTKIEKMIIRAITTQDDLVTKEMLIDLNDKLEKYYEELKKDMGAR